MIKFGISFACVLALLYCPLGYGSAVDLNRQAQVKAAFIFQFRNYITWPEETDDLETKNFIISVVGGDSVIVQELEKLANTKKMKTRSIEIQSVAAGANLPKSEIIVVASSETDVLEEVLRKTKGENSLIVTQAEGFAKKGSMVNFFVEDERLRFEVNLAAVKKEGLHVSSQLLNLARIINE